MTKRFEFTMGVLLGWLMIAVAAVGLMWGFSQVAFAGHQQPVCNTYEFFAGVLIDQYGEQLVDTQKKNQGGRYEIWKNAGSGTWTLLEIMPDTIRTCVIGSGRIDPHSPDDLMQRNVFIT